MILSMRLTTAYKELWEKNIISTHPCFAQIHKCNQGFSSCSTKVTSFGLKIGRKLVAYHTARRKSYGYIYYRTIHVTFHSNNNLNSVERGEVPSNKSVAAFVTAAEKRQMLFSAAKFLPEQVCSLKVENSLICLEGLWKPAVLVLTLLVFVVSCLLPLRRNKTSGFQKLFLMFRG